MSDRKRVDFGSEITKILPLILREVTRKQMTIFSRGRLPLPHVAILDLLVEKGPCKMGDLAETLHLTMSAVTGIVDKMIERNFIRRERSRRDRRIVRVILLRKGEETAARLREERKNVAEDIFSVLTDSEKKEYLRLLRKVYNNLRKKQ